MSGSRSLDAANARYWAAKTPAEERAAYTEIKLLGGHDGYAGGKMRPAIVRWLRQLACWIEGDA